MIIIHPTSLTATLDAAAESFFHQVSIPTQQREEIATLVVSRQSQSGINDGFFIPFAAESETMVRLFSGERVNTSFAQSHIHLIEAARILKLLARDSYSVTQSIKSANHRMESMCYSKFCSKGECKTLTIAYLRFLLLDGTGNSTSRVNSSLTYLTDHRDRKGKWGNFPFYYTLLMLSETDNPLAIQELQYAASVCEQQQAQNWPADPISKRRQDIIARALARITLNV
jgi:hypothetical protein